MTEETKTLLELSSAFDAASVEGDAAEYVQQLRAIADRNAQACRDAGDRTQALEQEIESQSRHIEKLKVEVKRLAGVKSDDAKPSAKRLKPEGEAQPVEED